MPTRQPFQMPQAQQSGATNVNSAAGTQGGSGMSAGAVGGSVPARPALQMGGNGQSPQGGQPAQQGGGQAPQGQQGNQQMPEQRLPIDPYAGGPTAPMNIGPMLSPQGSQTPIEKQSLPGWGGQGVPGPTGAGADLTTPYGGTGTMDAQTDLGQQGQGDQSQMGSAMALRLMKAMGRV